MSRATSLTAAWVGEFLHELPAGVEAGPPAALEPALERLVREARAAWPGVEVGAGDFLRFVAARLQGGEPLPAALEGLRAADLYLACACARRVPGALAAFEARFFGELAVALSRERAVSARYEREDVEQMLRQKLFVGSKEAPPRIGGYTGRGDLKSWFRVVVVRLLMDLGTRERGEPVVVEEEILSALPEPRDDPELAHLKRHYQAEFRAAFTEAVRGLSSHERNLLRHWFVDAMGIDQLAVVHGVHRATAARWLASARGALVARLRQAMMGRLRLGQTELPSIMRLLRSQLVITPRAFRTREETPGRPGSSAQGS